MTCFFIFFLWRCNVRYRRILSDPFLRLCGGSPRPEIISSIDTNYMVLVINAPTQTLASPPFQRVRICAFRTYLVTRKTLAAFGNCSRHLLQTRKSVV